LGRKSTLLGVLARKPEAFQEKKYNIIERTIKLRDYLYNSMFATHQPSENNQPKARKELVRRDSVFVRLEAPPTKKSNIIIRTINSVSEFFVGSPEKETEALQLLRIVWEDIVKLSKKEIDNILRGPKDSIKSASGRVISTVLQQLIFEHLEKMERDCRGVNQVMHLKGLVSQHVVKMHLETQNIILQDNKTLSGKGDQPLEIQKTISEYIVRMSDETQNLIKYEAGKEDQAVKQLQELIFKNINKMRGAISLKEKYSSRVLFIAAEMGNCKFLVELIRLCPDLIWKVNDNGLSIFHIAVKHRHEDIYNLLYEIGAMKDMITPLKDENENNMLHLVGKTAKKRLADGIRVDFYKCKENYYGSSLCNHSNLLAAFTVPGGYNQDDGIPIFHSKATFVVFVVADAISLFSSSASILMFLSILTSRYAERDFLESIPNKLMAGLATSFKSQTSHTLAFGFIILRTIQ
ncbi:ankyrin repeat-containing domain, PGG domain protein, partial [Tanacetum coccineum]